MPRSGPTSCSTDLTEPAEEIVLRRERRRPLHALGDVPVAIDEPGCDLGGAKVDSSDEILNSHGRGYDIPPHARRGQAVPPVQGWAREGPGTAGAQPSTRGRCPFGWTRRSERTPSTAATPKTAVRSAHRARRARARAGGDRLGCRGLPLRRRSDGRRERAGTRRRPGPARRARRSRRVEPAARCS